MKYNFNLLDNQLPQTLNEFVNYHHTIKSSSKKTVDGYKTDLIMLFRFLKLYRGLAIDEEFERIKISNIDIDFLEKITLNDLIAFISFCEKYRGNGASARARKVASIKSFFTYLHQKSEKITKNPSINLETPKLGSRQPVFLYQHECIQLLENISGRNYFRDYAIVVLFLNTGIRVSELCSIDINNIGTDTIKVKGKGNKERTVYLNRACIKAIKRYKLERRSHEENKIDALFISERGKRISVRAVENLVERAVENAGLQHKKITPHKLRHTSATLMYFSGVDILKIQYILGHENLNTTMIYTHVSEEQLKQAVNMNPLANI